MELKNILDESHQERAIKKGHAAQENPPHSEKLKKLEMTRRIIGIENNQVSQSSVSSFYADIRKIAKAHFTTLLAMNVVEICIPWTFSGRGRKKASSKIS